MLSGFGGLGDITYYALFAIDAFESEVHSIEVTNVAFANLSYATTSLRSPRLPPVVRTSLRNFRTWYLLFAIAVGAADGTEATQPTALGLFRFGAVHGAVDLTSIDGDKVQVNIAYSDYTTSLRKGTVPYISADRVKVWILLNNDQSATFIG